MSLPRLRLSPVPPAPRLPRVCGQPVGVRPAHAAWLADGRAGYLKDGDRFYRGRWTRRDPGWTFSFSSRTGAQLVGSDLELEFIDDYWGARAILVLDADRSWTPRRYRAARRRPWKPCTLCGGVISEERPEHFRSEPNIVVCAPCHRDFVTPRSLGFIPGVAPVPVTANAPAPAAGEPNAAPDAPALVAGA